jgi:Methyltransferase domain
MPVSIYQDGTYLAKNPTWHEEDSLWKAHQVLKMLTKHNIHPKTICEVGCGAGGILSEVARNVEGTSAVGYEISPQAFTMCRKKATDSLEFRLVDVLATGDSYDLVMAIDVFEHVEDYIGFLRKLRTHGKFKIFHIPLDVSVQTIMRGSPISNLRNHVGHLHHFTKETALATLDVAGYVILDWFYTYGMLEGPTRSRLAKLATLPRKIALALHRDLAVRFLGGCSLMVLST